MWRGGKTNDNRSDLHQKTETEYVKLLIKIQKRIVNLKFSHELFEV